ncbi:MAG: hypothetical protein NVSMB27_04140 [Ktedonobacteraceae bacterium]
MQAPFVDPLSGLDVLAGHSQEVPLQGREGELQVMRFLLNTVAHDLPTGARALTISGEMGVGKTRLLAEMYKEARALGFRVLEGRTYESGSMFPYLPFIEALRPVIRSSSKAQMRHYAGLDDLPAGPHQDTSIAYGSASLARRQQGEQEGSHSTSPPHPALSDNGLSQGRQEGANDDGNISQVGMPLVAALARIFPELLSIPGVNVVPEVLSPDQEKFRLLDAVATLLERIAQEQPVLLGIDNLQWADSASLELTMYLTVRLHSSRVALVGVTRPPSMPGESIETSDPATMAKASTAVAKALGELMRQGLLLLLPLGPLNTRAAAQYLHALFPGELPEGLAQMLLVRAEGNPFFLEELVRMLTLNRQLVQHGSVWKATKAIGTELPGSITLAVGQRLQALSGPCRTLLRVAALIGRTFPLDALSTVFKEIGVNNPILSSLEEAIQAGVIAIVADTDEADWHAYTFDDRDGNAEPMATSELHPIMYMFCQGIVQEVLSAEVPAHRASALHGAIGAALEAMYERHMAPYAAAHAAELARHYMLGGGEGNKSAALRWNLVAGEHAAQQQAYREAIGHFRLVLRLLETGVASTGNRASRLPQVVHLHITIGELWFKLGELEQASQSFQQALEMLQAQGNPDSSPGHPQEVQLRVAQVNRLMADAYRMQGKYDQALAYLQAARTALDVGTATDEKREGAPAQKTSYVPWFPGRSFSGGGNALTLERVSTAERILSLQAQATLDILFYRTKEAETALWQSHQLATETGDRGSQAFALHLVGWLRGWGEHIYEAIRLQEQAHELYIAIGDPFHAALGDQGLGIIYLALGEAERAYLYTLAGLERARRYGVRYSLGWLHWNFGAIALARGDWNGSASHLQEAMQEAEANKNTRLRPLIMQAQAELSFRQGNWREAENLFQASILAAANTEWYASTMALYGHFLAVTGRRTAARTQLERAAAFPEPPGYGGDFYIPFLAEGYIHLEAHKQAAAYVQRIRALRGFMYYGNSVDRILGVVETQAGNWEMAEQAFEDGLALCRRANNQPEEATILYEQARAALAGARLMAPHSEQALRRVNDLCNQARKIFLQYAMQRAVDQVDTLQEGLRQLKTVGALSEASGVRFNTSAPQSIAPQPHSEYQLHLSLTRREQEVLRLVAEGHTDREVAEALVISPRTVNRHLSNIFVKLNVPGRAAAVAYAIRQGLV